MTHNADLGKDKSLQAMDNAFVFALGLHAWRVLCHIQRCVVSKATFNIDLQTLAMMVGAHCSRAILVEHSILLFFIHAALVNLTLASRVLRALAS